MSVVGNMTCHDTGNAVCQMSRKQLEECHMSVVGNMICHDTGNAVCQMSRKQLEKCHMSVVGNMICHNRKCCVSDGQEMDDEMFSN